MAVAALVGECAMLEFRSCCGVERVVEVLAGMPLRRVGAEEEDMPRKGSGKDDCDSKSVKSVEHDHISIESHGEGVVTVRRWKSVGY